MEAQDKMGPANMPRFDSLIRALLTRPHRVFHLELKTGRLPTWDRAWPCKTWLQLPYE